VSRGGDIFQAMNTSIENGIKTIHLEKNAWQMHCWKAAQSREIIEVQGFSERYYPLFREFCAAYDYDLRWEQARVFLVPLTSAASRA
jgi:hypothetical protein